MAVRRISVISRILPSPQRSGFRSTMVSCEVQTVHSVRNTFCPPALKRAYNSPHTLSKSMLSHSSFHGFFRVCSRSPCFLKAHIFTAVPYRTEQTEATTMLEPVNIPSLCTPVCLVIKSSKMLKSHLFFSDISFEMKYNL